ncbi:MAG: substrate-binding domain-containing protein [Firmicutes bacterium]|nr:substrate-binding domain-containing protein [Bacillota bacterium]
MARPTIRDVARAAGVSVATVSYVLNGSPAISAETRERVLQAIAALDYRPNRLARGLANRKTDTLALLLPTARSVSDPFLFRFISGVSEAAAQAGYSLLLVPGRPGLAALEELVKDRRADGVILMEVEVRDPRIDYLLTANFPFVLFGRSLEHPEVLWVDLDNELGAMLATRHLLALGHRRIGYIGADRRLVFARHRYQGHLTALREAGVPVDPDLLVEGDLTERSGFRCMERLLALPSPPTAVFAACDAMAIGAKQALAAAGLRVPQDVAVVGFDDSPIAEFAIPPLTTVRQPTFELGAEAVRLLVSRLRGEAQPGEHRLLPPELVVRTSCGAQRVVETAPGGDLRMPELALKEADLFLVCSDNGDVVGGSSAQGLYFRDTRYLSQLELRVSGEPAHLLSASAAENLQMRFYYLGRKIEPSPGDPDPLTSLGIQRRRVIDQGVLYEQIELIQYGTRPVNVQVELRFGADFRDLFEARGMVRPARGVDLPPEVGTDRVILGYRGLDHQVRRTLVVAQTPPAEMDGRRAVWTLSLAAGQRAQLSLAVAPERDGGFPEIRSFNEALERLQRSYAEWLQQTAVVETDNPLVNRTLERSRLDLRALLTDLGYGPMTVAGIPWFAVPFGRDSVITALQTLMLNPSLAVGTLKTLAALQGREVNPARLEEPGKILHEMRSGEMANLGEIPYGRYYGTVDATPLFLVLVGETYRWTGDLELAASLLPQIKAALEWIHKYGDLDGDGFVEYQSDPQGLKVQSWKDSHDSMAHRSGELASAPMAVSEVQGYVYDAYRKLAPLLRDLAAAGYGDDLAALAAELEARADALQARFAQAFWMPDRQFYAIALDREKRQVGTVSSNPGHCLWSGIVPPEHRRAVADLLMSDRLFSGWGVRTLAEGETTYNPMSYHNGSVWPHDNAIIALGLKRAGFDEYAARLAEALFKVANYFPYNRLPELFCGHPASEGEPVQYPVACSPQAWAAATPFMLTQAILGLEPDAPRGTLRLRPRLPASIGWMRVQNLRVGRAVVDLEVTRDRTEAKVREGALQVIVE